MIKQALLLAAGKGTRLRPLTNKIPKCLVPINGKPLLEIWLSSLSESGVEQFFINTHYLSEQVEAYIAQSAFKDRVVLIHEASLLGTLGTLRHFVKSHYVSDDLLVAHADNLVHCDWRGFYQAHAKKPEKTCMTMMTFETPDPKSCGILEMDNQCVLLNMHEKVSNPPGNTANGAIFVMSESLLKNLERVAPDGDEISLHLIPRLYKKIFCYQCDGYLQDIGTSEMYKTASEAFLQFQ